MNAVSDTAESGSVAGHQPASHGRFWYRQAILTAAEMQKAEALSIAASSIPSFSLMRRAGRATAKAGARIFPENGRLLVLCGPGNNGGDGYIAAQHLAGLGFDCTVATIAPSGTADSQEASRFWRGRVVPLSADLLQAEDWDGVIDGLFGTGLTRPVSEPLSSVFQRIGETSLPVLAIDLPSGINSDTGAVMGAALSATHCVTFFRKKRGHVLFPGRGFCGEVLVADIGIADTILEEIQPQSFENGPALWHRYFQPPSFRPMADGTISGLAHKYQRGHLAVFGAAMGGAVSLAARAAQMSGSGAVSILAEKDSSFLQAHTCPASVIIESGGYDKKTIRKRGIRALALGMGMVDREAAANRLSVQKAFSSSLPLVLDAGALTSFAEDDACRRALLTALRKHGGSSGAVLTPHEGEFQRVFADCGQGDKLARTRLASAMTGAVVVLKGADTVIASPDGRAIVNTNAAPNLATAGSGDLLSGLIAGFMARSVPGFAAAATGVWCHGTASQSAPVNATAEDILEHLACTVSALYDRNAPPEDSSPAHCPL